MAAVCDAVAAKLDGAAVRPARHRHRAARARPHRRAARAARGRCCRASSDRPLSVAPSLRLWERASEDAPARAPARRVRRRPSPPRRRGGDRDAARRATPRRPRSPASRRRSPTSRERSTAPTRRTSPRTGASATTTRCSRASSSPTGTSRSTTWSACGSVPRQIVLASCETGLSAVHAGDELMGFTAAVFALGTQTVIAAVVPVPDEATKGLMLALDEELSRGRQPRHGAGQRAERTAPRRRARLSASVQADYPGASEDEASPPVGRTRPDDRGGVVLRADDPGVRRQALPDPVGVDGADAPDGSAHPRGSLQPQDRRRPEAR